MRNKSFGQACTGDNSSRSVTVSAYCVSRGESWEMITVSRLLNNSNVSPSSNTQPICLFRRLQRLSQRVQFVRHLCRLFRL